MPQQVKQQMVIYMYTCSLIKHIMYMYMYSHSQQMTLLITIQIYYLLCIVMSLKRLNFADWYS